MIIIKQNNITIPRGISPSFVTTDHDISLQKKSVTITKNGVSTITPDPSYDALSSVKVTTDIHQTPKLQNIVKTYVENGNYRLDPGSGYDGIGNVSITIDVPEKVFKTQDKNISITENGDYNVSKDSSVDGMTNVSISVNVPERVINLQDKNISISENGHYNVAKDSSFDGMNNVSISVNVPEKVFKTQDKNENIVSNGDYRYSADESFDGLKSVNVHVEVPEKKIILQNKDITENGSVTYDEGFDGLGTVNVNVPIPEYKSQTKDVSYVNNGSFTLKPDIDFDGISQANINVNVPERVYKTQEKTAVPTTSEQRIIPDSSVDYLSAVNISAVDSTIDSNIIPANIKKGVSILGVEGTNEPHVSPMGTVLAQDILSDEPAPQNLVYNAAEHNIDGYSNVEIERIAQERITKTITANGTVTIKPSTDYDVIKDVNINVNVPSKDPNLQEKTLAKSDLITNTNKTVTVELVPDSSFAGMSKVSYEKIKLNNNFTVEFRTPSDDKFSGLNLNVPVAGFDGVSKLSYKTRRQDKTVTPSTTKQTVNCDSGYVGIRSVTVNPVTSAIDSNIKPANIKKGVSILGVEGSLETGTSTNYVPLKYIEYSDNVFYRLLSGNVNLARDFKLRLTYSKSNPYGYLISINNDTQHLFEIFDQANLATTATLRYYDPDNDKSNIVNVDTDYRENRLIDYLFIHSKQSSTSDYYYNEVTLNFTDDSNVESGDFMYTKYGNNMYAFARYLNGVLTPAGSTGLRIYQIQVMYHIDNLASSLPLMANFIPVIYNGQAGFLETNTKVFSPNLGTGTPKYEIL